MDEGMPKKKYSELMCESGFARKNLGYLEGKMIKLRRGK